MSPYHLIQSPIGGQAEGPVFARPSPEDLMVALRRAVRHGQPDLARRLADRLVGDDREILTLELAGSAIGGDQ